jgi:hypothetical protein
MVFSNFVSWEIDKVDSGNKTSELMDIINNQRINIPENFGVVLNGLMVLANF